MVTYGSLGPFGIQTETVDRIPGIDWESITFHHDRKTRSPEPNGHAFLHDLSVAKERDSLQLVSAIAACTPEGQHPE